MLVRSRMVARECKTRELARPLCRDSSLGRIDKRYTRFAAHNWLRLDVFRSLLWHAAHHLWTLWCRKDRVDNEQEKQLGSHARHDADDRTNVGHARSKNNHVTFVNQKLQRIVDATREKHCHYIQLYFLLLRLIFFYYFVDFFPCRMLAFEGPLYC